MAEAEGRGIAAGGGPRGARLGLRARSASRTLVSYIAPGNGRSIRLAERLGAVADPAARAPAPTPASGAIPARRRGVTAAPAHRDRAAGAARRTGWRTSRRSPPSRQRRRALRRRPAAARASAWYGFAADVGAWDLMGFGCWAIEEKATGAFAGQVGAEQAAVLPRARDRLDPAAGLRGPRLRHRGGARRPRLGLRHPRLDHRRQLHRPRQPSLDRGRAPPRLRRGPRAPSRSTPRTSSSATPPRRRCA